MHALSSRGLCLGQLQLRDGRILRRLRRLEQRTCFVRLRVGALYTPDDCGGCTDGLLKRCVGGQEGA